MGAQAVRLSNLDIDNALKHREFELLFQPIFSLQDGSLCRVETFLRWRHSTMGLLPPGAFISFFEQQGRMSELTRYVLQQALESYCSWRGPFPPGFSINLALSDLADESLPTHFSRLLRDYQFPANAITLECPMPPVDMPHDLACAHFDRLKATGAKLAIEVRGRANDFLRKIDPFPFDEIKTGGAAILRFARTVRGPGLTAISELLDLANLSGAAISAVGVEDQSSLSALKKLGFTAAQGNHLSRVGQLTAFTSSQVNEVRALLGLLPLTRGELDALFNDGTHTASASLEDNQAIDALERPDAAAPIASTPETEAPSPTAQEEEPAQSATRALHSHEDRTTTAEDDDDALIERLSKRIKENAQAKEMSPPSAQKKRATIKPDEPLSEADAAARALQNRLSDEFSDKNNETSPLDSTAKQPPLAATEDQSTPVAAQQSDSLPIDNGSDERNNAEADERPQDQAIAAIDEETASSKEAQQGEQNSPPSDDVEQQEAKPLAVASSISDTPSAMSPSDQPADQPDNDQPSLEETPLAAESEPEVTDPPLTETTPDTADHDDRAQQSTSTAGLSQSKDSVTLHIANVPAYFIPVLTITVHQPSSPTTPQKNVNDLDDIDVADPATIHETMPSGATSPASDEITVATYEDLVLAAERNTLREEQNIPVPPQSSVSPQDETPEASASRADILKALHDAPTEPNEPPAPEHAAKSGSPQTVDTQTESTRLTDTPPVTADVSEETPAEEVFADPVVAPPKKRRHPRKKNFLTRKYRIWPTHFWPKSWKRAWARRAAYRASLQDE